MSIVAALQVAGNILQGVSAYRSGMANASALEQSAVATLRQGAAQESDLRYQARQQIGQQAAAQWSNGFMGGTGSALDALHESQVNAALDAMRIRRAAMDKSNSLNFQAGRAREGAWFGLATGLLGAGSAAAGQKADWGAATASAG